MAVIPLLTLEYEITILTLVSFFSAVGVASTLMIEAIHLNPPGNIDKVEFLNLMGEPIFEAQLTPSSLNPDMYVATNVIPPNEYFHIRVSGIDGRNLRFQRITKAAISPLVPGDYLL